MQTYQQPPTKKPDKNIEPELEDSVAANASEQPTDDSTAEIYTLVRYEVSDEQIGKMAKEFAPLSEPDADYEQRRKAIATCRELRVGVETTRVRLKRSALEYGRKVDSTAKHYTGLLEAIEEPLKLTKGSIDDEKDRVKREREEAERAELEAKVRAEREAEEARLRVEREAEEARLAKERMALEAERAALAEKTRKADEAASVAREKQEAIQRARQAELDAEAAKLKTEREAAAEKARKELEAIEAEKRALREQREAQERAEFERAARVRAEQEAKARAEEERIAAEEAKVREAERVAAAQARIEALKPDVDKVRAFADEIRSLAVPDVKSDEAKESLNHALLDLATIATGLDRFGSAQPESIEPEEMAF